MILNNKFFSAAYAVALSSTGVGGKNKNFRLGAVLVYKKKILTAKCNSYKTHPKVCRYYLWPTLHAEAAAILSLGLDNCEGTSLFVLRILKNKDIAMAKPCSCCMKLILSVGIKNIFFTTSEGYRQLCLR